MEKEHVVCDTDVLIDYWDNASARHLATKDILENFIGLDNVVISAITLMELMAGSNNKVEENRIQKKLNRFNTALINQEITMAAIKLFGMYHLSHGLAIPDCFIASTAQVMAIPLFTYNLKDFKFIDGLWLYQINR